MSRHQPLRPYALTEPGPTGVPCALCGVIVASPGRRIGVVRAWCATCYAVTIAAYHAGITELVPFSR